MGGAGCKGGNATDSNHSKGLIGTIIELELASFEA
jgi:hypothetical protein